MEVPVLVNIIEVLLGVLDLAHIQGSLFQPKISNRVCKSSLFNLRKSNEVSRNQMKSKF